MNDAVQQIREACLRLLAVRDHSKQELVQKLSVKGYDRDIAQSVIDELASEGLQNDSRYAESYARSRILKGYGPVRIIYELRLNGVDIARRNSSSITQEEEVATNFCLDAIVQTEAGSWTELLVQVYNKKYSQDTLLLANEWAKRSRFLIQRGFTGHMIAALFEHLNIKLI